MPLIRFPDPSIASETLGEYGYDLRITQLEKGSLSAHVAGSNCEEALFLEFGSDRTMLLQGQSIPGYLEFAMCVPGSENWFHGSTTTGGQLCGYNAGLTDNNCRHKGVMKLIMLPLQKIYAYLLECNAHLAAERLMATNWVNLTPEQSAEFMRVYGMGASGRLTKAEQCYNLITCLLSTPGETELYGPTKNERLLRRMVELAHDEAEGEALSLLEITRFLNCKDSTLRDACVKAYGISVKQLFKMVRLEQVRCSLAKPEALNTVEAAFAKYGFGVDNISRHRKLYRETFGERPVDTQQRGLGQLMLQLH